jgi:hypothetical protein
LTTSRERLILVRFRFPDRDGRFVANGFSHNQMEQDEEEKSS